MVRRLTISLPDDNYEFLVAWAAREDRAISNLVNRLLMKLIEEEKARIQAPESGERKQQERE
ncbi:ribbon-helix-helix domain-containing protein [Leptolyngbya sp. FACHB-261]|uniref:ribbon-helix-helix domain-containing protein n=1 Tax=Leptolyngbya sp. FACHB-261 TaxID=2692806 RepID=UPI0016831900|nr:hypothetical protein [Leptolyngbya sp. FACHB-261]MBD2099998.1 hypothetical protein [Leptolyngbya sp. FACHB-261]